MYRRTKLMMIAAGGAGLVGAMLLLPGGERAAVADAPQIAAITSQETIATIDAMLGTSEAETAPIEVASVRSGVATQPAAMAEPDPENFQTAALTEPVPEVPAIDPNLRPDSIGSSAVNLRTGPSTASATVAVLQPGQTVHTGPVSDGWVEVTLADGTTGWVYSRYLASVAAATPAKPAASTETRSAKATVKGKGTGDLEGRTARIEAAITARAKPEGSSRGVFRTSPGERVRILDVRGDWLRIRTADGSSGWIEAG
jgi:SH3-like domain-containing protein